MTSLRQEQIRPLALVDQVGQSEAVMEVDPDLQFSHHRLTEGKDRLSLHHQPTVNLLP